MEHLGCERGLSLLHYGVHGVWGSPLHNFLHAAEFLLEALEYLFPRSFSYSLLRGVWFLVYDVPPKCCFDAFLFRGWVWSMPPGTAGFCLRFSASGSATVGLPFLRGDIMTFLSWSHLLRALHLPGEFL